MNKEQFLAHAEKAYDEMKVKPEKVFMFHFLQFDFSYDDENRQCHISCPVTEFMYNPSGIMHGGIATFIADTAMGHLNFRLKDAPYVSLDLHTSFLRAATTGKLYATARYVKEGHKVSFMECVIKNDENEIICTTTGTFYRIEK